MEWLQVLAIIVSNLGIILPLILWFRSEARRDNIMTQEWTQRMFHRCDDQLATIKQDMKDFQDKFHQETKDFHGRLISLEERNRK